jgi:hypothetical protein
MHIVLDCESNRRTSFGTLFCDFLAPIFVDFAERDSVKRFSTLGIFHQSIPPSP